MAVNKNQHFVPKIYLKAFSEAHEGKSISLFNLSRMRSISSAPVKSQCSRDYFYGKDEKLESAIQFVEQGYGKFINEVTAGSKFKPLHDAILKRFWYLQYLRTEAAAKLIATQSYELAQASKIEVPWPNSGGDLKYAVNIAIRSFAHTMEIIDDLKVRVFRNKTRTPFITSDDPSITINKFYDKSNLTKGLNYGLSSAGAIALLPLSPMLIAVMFDGAIYSVPHEGFFSDIYKVEDVEACNELQILNCSSNIYFNNEVGSLDLQKAINAAVERRVLRKFDLTIAKREKSEAHFETFRVVPEVLEADDSDVDKHDSYLFHLSPVRPRVTRWPSFLKMREKRYAYYNGTRAGYIRNLKFAGDNLGNPWTRIRV